MKKCYTLIVTIAYSHSRSYIVYICRYHEKITLYLSQPPIKKNNLKIEDYNEKNRRFYLPLRYKHKRYC